MRAGGQADGRADGRIPRSRDALPDHERLCEVDQQESRAQPPPSGTSAFLDRGQQQWTGSAEFENAREHSQRTQGCSDQDCGASFESWLAPMRAKRQVERGRAISDFEYWNIRDSDILKSDNVDVFPDRGIFECVGSWMCSNVESLNA